MARGRPDFFGTPIHPSYGDVVQFSGDVVAVSKVETTIKEVLGKGTWFHAQLYSYNANSKTTDIIRLYVDDIMIMQRQWGELNRYGFIHGSGALFKVTCYDPDSPFFVGLFNAMLPFREKAKITYFNDSLVNYNVTYLLDYYDILRV